MNVLEYKWDEGGGVGAGGWCREVNLGATVIFNFYTNFFWGSGKA